MLSLFYGFVYFWPSVLFRHSRTLKSICQHTHMIPLSHIGEFHQVCPATNLPHYQGYGVIKSLLTQPRHDATAFSTPKERTLRNIYSAFYSINDLFLCLNLDCFSHFKDGLLSLKIYRSGLSLIPIDVP